MLLIVVIFCALPIPVGRSVDCFNDLKRRLNFFVPCKIENAQAREHAHTTHTHTLARTLENIYIVSSVTCRLNPGMKNQRPRFHKRLTYLVAYFWKGKKNHVR